MICIKNAYENIKRACDDKLSKMYPVQLPGNIAKRYNQELEYLKESECINEFELFRLFSMEASKYSMPINARYGISGSFIYYLLGETTFNPLNTHYYCPDCGYYEEIDTVLFGIDIPNKACPQCGRYLNADGYNFEIESIWGNDGKKVMSFDYDICDDFLPIAWESLKKIYPDYKIVPWRMLPFDLDVETCDTCDYAKAVWSGFVICNKETAMTSTSVYVWFEENGELYIISNDWGIEESGMAVIKMFPSDSLSLQKKLLDESGVCLDEISICDIKDVEWNEMISVFKQYDLSQDIFYQKVSPETYYEMVAIEASTHNSLVWNTTDGIDLIKYNEMVSEECFAKYPCYTREDFFYYLLQTGTERKFAFKTSEQIRKGYANTVYKTGFEKLPISEDIKKVSRNYKYVCSRATCIEKVLGYARMVYCHRKLKDITK